MKKWTFIFLVIFLLGLTTFFFFCWLNSGVSLKYEVFEPTESYYYTTLKGAKERQEYVKDILKHNSYIYNSEVINKTAMVATLFTAIGLLAFRKRIVK